MINLDNYELLDKKIIDEFLFTRSKINNITHADKDSKEPRIFRQRPKNPCYILKEYLATLRESKECFRELEKMIFVVDEIRKSNCHVVYDIAKIVGVKYSSLDSVLKYYLQIKQPSRIAKYRNGIKKYFEDKNINWSKLYEKLGEEE